MVAEGIINGVDDGTLVPDCDEFILSQNVRPVHKSKYLDEAALSSARCFTVGPPGTTQLEPGDSPVRRTDDGLCILPGVVYITLASERQWNVVVAEGAAQVRLFKSGRGVEVGDKWSKLCITPYTPGHLNDLREAVTRARLSLPQPGGHGGGGVAVTAAATAAEWACTTADEAEEEEEEEDDEEEEDEEAAAVSESVSEAAEAAAAEAGRAAAQRAEAVAAAVGEWFQACKAAASSVAGAAAAGAVAVAAAPPSPNPEAVAPRVGAVASTVAALSDCLKDEHAASQTTATELRSEVAALEADLAASGTRQEALAADVKGMQTAVQVLECQRKVLTTNYGALSAELEAAQANSALLSNALEKERATHHALQRSAATADAYSVQMLKHEKSLSAQVVEAQKQHAQEQVTA